MAAMSAAEAAAYAASRRRVFVIAGHGMETPGSFPLSGECEVVVKKNTCEVAFESDFNKGLEGLLSLPEEMALHPIQYRNEITQRLGSVMVYSRNQPRIIGTEGSCLNFMYHLMMMHFREDARGKHVEIHYDMGSGIIDLARWKAARKHVGPSRVIIVREGVSGSTAKNIQMIGGLYEHSVFPTMEFVDTYLGIRWKEKETEIYDMLVDLRKQPFINVTQNFLCDHFAGVYYHMICRSMAPHVIPKIKEYVSQWQNWKKGNAPVNVRKIKDNRLFDERYVIESAQRRRAYDRYYHSEPFQKRQHTTNMANCRNLETSMTTLEGLLHAVNATNATNAVKQKEKEKIQRRIRFFRTIRNNKHANSVHRGTNAQRAQVQRVEAQREEAYQAALKSANRTSHREAQRQVEEVPRVAQRAKKTAQRNHSRRHSRSRSRSPTRHSGSQTHKKSQNRGNKE
jgi:hypothetical protein